MARTYAKSFVSMWDPDSDFLDLPSDAQWLYWVLFSHHLLSPAGVLPLQPRKWATRAKDMTPKRITAALRTLVARRYVLTDDDTVECLVRTFIRHDQGWRTPNIRKSIETSIGRIESEPLRVAARHELTLALTLAGIQPEGFPDGSGQGSGQGKGEGKRHRTPPPPPPEDSPPPPPPSDFQSSSTSTVSTRPDSVEDDQESDGTMRKANFLKAVEAAR